MKKILMASLAIMSTFSLAGVQTGKVDTLYARADGLHVVTLKGGTSKNSSPTCATADYWIIKDEDSTYGKSQFSQLLAAKLAGKSVTINGLNTCTRWGDGEDISYIVINDN